MSFAGFPEAALDFYEGLEADNTKAYWTDHRQTYEQCVKAPMLELLAGLEPEFGSAKLFRPYRDVRFSKDKTPYKSAAAAWADDTAGGGLYLQLSAHGLLVAGGAYQLATDQARRMRAAAAQDRPGQALVRLLDRLTGSGFSVGGQRLVRVPKEFGTGHPRADLLTSKTLVASWQAEPAQWLHTGEAADRVAERWRALRPLNAWLGEHVGPPRVQRQG